MGIYYKFFILFQLFLSQGSLSAINLSETSYLIAGVKPHHIENLRFWDYLRSEKNTGIEVNLSEVGGEVFISDSRYPLSQLVERIHYLVKEDTTRILPVFINFSGNTTTLENIVHNSVIASDLFFLPRGETWPSLEFMNQANRRIIFFLSGTKNNESRMFHQESNYIFGVSAVEGAILPVRPDLELLMIKDFEKLPVNKLSDLNIRNLVPDYINFLLETWTRFGKRPNFIFVNDRLMNFDFIINQLNSFTWLNGTIKGSGKNLGKVYWKNSDVTSTGRRFSFPYRGGEELTLTPFVPGYKLTPEHIIVTGEMEVPENFDIMAAPLTLSDGLSGIFPLDQSIQNILDQDIEYEGQDYSFVQDIERGTVLRLPEGASINLKSPELYGLRNSSFTVGCFVKFSEIMDSGDNAILGNHESEYRRGLHLILRSGQPYFGLWANDYISEEKLVPDVWFHLVWRYIIETGEQAIFLNGRNIGSSEGHPPFLGTGDIYLGSALSSGASLRGYIDELHFWNRPLGTDEIIRLSLNEPVRLTVPDSSASVSENYFTEILLALLFLIIIIIGIVFFKRERKQKPEHIPVMLHNDNPASHISLFGGFNASDREGNDISGLFTPKVKELLIFVLLSTIKNGRGAAVSDINEQLWPDIASQKVSNNRAVTLNKLRKILFRMDGIEIITRNGMLLIQMAHPFTCDYVEAYGLCHLTGGMDRSQLETFRMIVQKGQFLKGMDWQWLDEPRESAGTSVIDNLLKLALLYKNDKKFADIEIVSDTILEYDDLNEEAIWLKTWVLRQRNDGHQARYYFDAFRNRYQQSLGLNYPMSYEMFNIKIGELLQESYAKVKSIL